MQDELRNLAAEEALSPLLLQLQILLYYRAEGGRMSGLCGPTMFGVILITRYRECLSSAAHISPPMCSISSHDAVHCLGVNEVGAGTLFLQSVFVLCGGRGQ